MAVQLVGLTAHALSHFHPRQECLLWDVGCAAADAGALLFVFDIICFLLPCTYARTRAGC